MLSALHRSATVTTHVSPIGIATTVSIGGRVYRLQTYYGRKNDVTYVSDEYQTPDVHGLQRNRGRFADLALGNGEALAELPGVDTDDLDSQVDIDLPKFTASENRALAALLHPFLAAHTDGLRTWPTAPMGRWIRTVDMDSSAYGEWRQR